MKLLTPLRIPKSWPSRWPGKFTEQKKHTPLVVQDTDCLPGKWVDGWDERGFTEGVGVRTMPDGALIGLEHGIGTCEEWYLR